MYDPQLGMYEKFKVERTDGRSEPGQKHHNCRYFVLDLNHDRHARKAILAYAESCKSQYPFLSRDLFAVADDMLEHPEPIDS